MGKGDLSTRTLPESEYPDWCRLVAESPDGSPYSLPAYLDALCIAVGGSFRVLVVEQGSELVGGVALFEQPSALGRFVSPRLLLYYNGFVLTRYATKYPSQRTSRQVKAFTALQQAVASLRFGSVALKSRSTVSDVRPFLASGWSARLGYTYVVSLVDMAAAWSRVEQNLRRLVERCGASGVTVSDDDDFDGFYRLHAAGLERRSTQAYLPQRSFDTLFRTLRRHGLARLYHARLPDGRPVASQLVLTGPHPTTHTVSAASDSELNHLGSSAFLRWKVFEDLARQGYLANDLTDASLNPVTHFKSQLGGELQAWLELCSPQTLAYRCGTSTGAAVRRLRGSAGSVARRATTLLRPVRT
jgi:hypothetical protein